MIYDNVLIIIFFAENFSNNNFLKSLGGFRKWTKKNVQI